LGLQIGIEEKRSGSGSGETCIGDEPVGEKTVRNKGKGRALRRKGTVNGAS